MLANYGYKDGSGDFFITIDTDKCTGCGECVKACPCPPQEGLPVRRTQTGGKVLEMITDESDPFREIPVVAVTDEHRNKIKYSCSPCKPPSDRPVLPCVNACKPNAIAHSW